MKQNIVKIMVCALIAAFALTVPVMASDTGKKAEPAAREKSAEPAGDAKSAADNEKPAVAEPVTITGTVEKTDAGIVIKTAETVYTVAGKDLAEMVGKSVNATGTVDGQTITVTEAKVAEKK